MKSLRRVWAAAQRTPFAQHIKIGNQEAERYLILTRLLKTDEAMRLARQVSLRSLTTFNIRVTLDCRPDLLGDIIPKPHLRFAAVLRISELRLPQSAG